MEEIYLSDIPESEDVTQFLKKLIQGGIFRTTFIYDSHFSNTPKLRALMESLFDIFDFDPKDKNRLVLVSDELNNNAVEHGSDENSQNKTKIVIEPRGKKIYVNIEVTDSGDGTAEGMERMKREKDSIGFEKHHSIRGRGLFLITERIADKLYFKDAE
jgi:anti-sigma regulatory factor (Ser/Thr protein kinase)